MWRRFAGPGPWGLGLARILADGRRAVNTPETVPQSPLKGDVGKFFCPKFPADFCAEWRVPELWPGRGRRNFRGNFYQQRGDYRGAITDQG